MNFYKGEFKYKYVPYGDGAKAIISNATMKFTHPKDFNDPFDCLPSYKINSFDVLKTKYNHVIKDACKSMNYSPAQRIKKKREMEARLTNSLSKGTWQDSIRKSIGICSMTTHACNLLMWAHYAKEHTGMVFEFKNLIPENEDDYEEYLCSFKVKYEIDKPINDLSEASYEHDLLVKGKDWEYEDEVRCLDFWRKSGIHPYKRDLLSSIILGIRFDAKLEKGIRELVSSTNNIYGTNIKIYNAKVVKDKFKIFIPDHPIYGDPDWK
ncbi:TPA: DUF2971 domain-containing protein [Vibrio metoecus]